jgi:hypothetical protein
MSIEDLLASLEESDAELCYPARIASLRQRGREVEHIERGISQTVENLNKKEKSFVVYGEPQSGKTEFMIALCCKLIDLKYQTIFIVMNDNTELETQNFERFHSSPELNPVPQQDFQLRSTSDEELRIQKQRIIFCRKNSSNLQTLIDRCRHMERRIVIDDEADYATPNAAINREQLTAINRYLGELGDLHEGGLGTYIGVTATPARLDLNNTFLNNSLRWVFLESHKNYKGRSFFFPMSKEDHAKSDYQLVKLPDDGDDPRFLRHAVFRFLCRVALLNLNDASEQTAYSMLIHTAGGIHAHETDQQDLEAILRRLSDRKSKNFAKYSQELLNIASTISEEYGKPFTGVEIATFVIRRIGSKEVLVINHKNHRGNVKKAGSPNALFTFAIGGNIVSRGLTFENLLTFFFSRSVRGRLQQNTYIQRARMFGSRPYSKYFELCVPSQLFEDWANCFQDHDLSLRLAQAGYYQHIETGRTRVVDNAAIDHNNVTVERSERAVGDIFNLTSELEKLILDHNEAKPLEFIKRAIEDGLIKEEHFPQSLLTYINETAAPNLNDVMIVLKTNADGKSLQKIESYGDGNAETISRPRGGIIHAMLNRRVEYSENNHFILPIKNESGQARFLYKANLGQVVMQNLRVNRAIN